MSKWESDPEVRERLRSRVKDLWQEAETHNDGSEGDLHKAHAHLELGNFSAAQEASLDLGLAAFRCHRPALKDLIEKVRSRLDEALEE